MTRQGEDRSRLRTTTPEADMTLSSRVGQLLQLTEVTSTAASYAVFFLQAVAATDRTKKLTIAAAVTATARRRVS